MSDPETNLNAQALLASLSFGLCRQSRQLKEEANNVEDRNHAQRGVTKVSLFYFQQAVEETKTVKGKQVTTQHVNDALCDIKSHFGKWRSAHNSLCPIAWDTGTGLLPAKLVQLYLETKSEFEEAMPNLLAEFVAAYPDWRTTAPDRMGNLFNEDDFPTLQECRDKISWDCALIPLPSGEQFRRIKLIAPNLTEEMENSTNSRIARAVAEAREQTWKDLFDPINHLIEVLAKDKARLHETLLGNLHQILDRAPAFNLSGDRHMDEFVAQARQVLGSVSIDDLRSDPALRQQTVKNAQALLATFGEVGRRSFIA